MLRILFISTKELYLRLKQNSLAIKMASILTNNYSTNELIFNNLSLDYCAKTLERERERERERELTSKHASNKNISGGIFRLFLGLRFKDAQAFITEYSPINTSIVVSVNTFVSPIYFCCCHFRSARIIRLSMPQLCPAAACSDYTQLLFILTFSSY